MAFPKWNRTFPSHFQIEIFKKRIFMEFLWSFIIFPKVFDSKIFSKGEKNVGWSFHAT